MRGRTVALYGLKEIGPRDTMIRKLPTPTPDIRMCDICGHPCRQPYELKVTDPGIPPTALVGHERCLSDVVAVSRGIWACP